MRMSEKVIYVVEDHPLMRDLLQAYLKSHGDYHVCGVAPSAEIAMDELEKLDPDLVIVDVSLPDMNGIDLVEELRARYPGLLCLMLSGHHDASYVERALLAGARGYIIKGNPTELFDAIETVLAGEVYVSQPPSAYGTN